MAELPPEPGDDKDDFLSSAGAHRDGGRGADEVDLEMLFGPDVWDGPSGDLASDILALREIGRLGADEVLFGGLAGEAELRQLLRKARQAGDRQLMIEYAADLYALDPERWWRRIRQLRRPDEHGSAASEGDAQEPEPPVGSPLQSVAELRGRRN